jgi:putative transposase
MARPLRLEFPGAIYHVTSRGNARAPIYPHHGDRREFLDLLGVVVDRFHWLCHGYCLMDNHYHLLLETPDGNLSAGMRHLNGVFTQRVNRRHGRVGHLFQGRFKAILVDRDAYLLELCRYVVLNPVRAGLVASPDDYLWSSYRATVGDHPLPPWLTTDWVLSQFGARRGVAQERYRQFVRAGLETPNPWEALRGQVVLGAEEFVERLAPLLRGSGVLKEVPRVQRFADRPALEALFAGLPARSRAARNARIRRAHRDHGYTLKEIADHLGLHYTTVSKAANGQI